MAGIKSSRSELEDKTEEFSEKDEHKDKKIGQGKLEIYTYIHACTHKSLIQDCRPPNNETQKEKEKAEEEIIQEIIQD